MIEVVLTLVSAQDGSRSDLGRATISLIGTSDRGRTGDYRLRILKAAHYSRNAGDTWKVGDICLSATPEHRSALVSDWPRTSKRVGPWELLMVCLDGLLHSRRPTGAKTEPHEEYTARLRASLGDILLAIGSLRPDSTNTAADGLAAFIEAAAGKIGIDVSELLGRIIAKTPNLYLISEPELQRITEGSFDHPKGWDGPCWCMECKASQ